LGRGLQDARSEDVTPAARESLASGLPLLRIQAVRAGVGSRFRVESAGGRRDPVLAQNPMIDPVAASDTVHRSCPQDCGVVG
jgi:hypothetical protein